LSTILTVEIVRKSNIDSPLARFTPTSASLRQVWRKGRSSLAACWAILRKDVVGICDWTSQQSCNRVSHNGSSSDHSRSQQSAKAAGRHRWRRRSIGPLLQWKTGAGPSSSPLFHFRNSQVATDPCPAENNGVIHKVLGMVTGSCAEVRFNITPLMSAHFGEKYICSH
jgi:hypothetical protein